MILGPKLDYFSILCHFGSGANGEKSPAFGGDFRKFENNFYLFVWPLEVGSKSGTRLSW
jgi:hypothetical protein